MRIRTVGVFLVMLFLAPHANAAQRKTYYLALGDSLAIGIQPSANGTDVPTDQGYTDDLYGLVHALKPGLSLVKLGCSGETTKSMFQGGGPCNYAEGSQLAEALSFLATHDISFITLDIGANDADQCISTTPTVSINPGCLETAASHVGTYLPLILGALRSASPNTPIIAMNYYDPVLAAWTLGAAGQTLAQESLLDTTSFNNLLEGIYQGFEVPVADVAAAFRIDNFTGVPVINLPINVFLTLTWTWMGAPAPIGPNVHPNTAGYLAIAVAFAEKIAR